MKMADFARGLKCGDFTASGFAASEIGAASKPSPASSDESATAPRPLAELVRKSRRLRTGRFIRLLLSSCHEFIEVGDGAGGGDPRGGFWQLGPLVGDARKRGGRFGIIAVAGEFGFVQVSHHGNFFWLRPT